MLHAKLNARAGQGAAAVMSISDSGAGDSVGQQVAHAAVMLPCYFWRQDDLVLGRKMGEGGYGSVYKAQLAGKPDSQVRRQAAVAGITL